MKMYEVMCKVCKGTTWKCLVPEKLLYGTQKILCIMECGACGEQFLGPFHRQDLKEQEPKHEFTDNGGSTG